MEGLLAWCRWGPRGFIKAASANGTVVAAANAVKFNFPARCYLF
jgi:hypothetical protein